MPVKCTVMNKPARFLLTISCGLASASEAPPERQFSRSTLVLPLSASGQMDEGTLRVAAASQSMRRVQSHYGRLRVQLVQQVVCGVAG